MLLVFNFFAYFMKIFDRQNMLIFFKIFNHRWRWLAWFHRFFGAQTNFFVNFIYKNPRKHLQNPWHSYHNFWQPKSRYRHKPDHLPPEYFVRFILFTLFSPLSQGTVCMGNPKGGGIACTQSDLLTMDMGWGVFWVIVWIVGIQIVDAPIYSKCGL